MENHLADEEDIGKIASAANTSQFHFQRMFALITDVTVAEYIRRRRLTLAAEEIQKGGDILETAFKYGYESQASFTRAFSRMHGLTPAKARNRGAVLKAYPPLSFNISITGAHSMDYEIREFGSMDVTGVIRSFTTVNGANLRDLPLFFEEMDREGTTARLMEMTGSEGKLKGSLLGICMDFDDESEQFNFMIGVEPREDKSDNLMERLTIPPLTWAVFPGKGKMPDSIQSVWKRIFSEWFPSMSYIHAEGPELEVYLPGPCENGECSFEIWIPIEKK